MYGVQLLRPRAYEGDVRPIARVRPLTTDASPQRAALTVAVVDDDRLMRESLGTLIRSLGYEVRLFDGGLALLAEDLAVFGCVISDMQMPIMSGLMLQDEIRERAPDLPIVFLTAFPDDWARSRALAAGARAFFEKPCDLEGLVEVVEAVVGPAPTRE